MEILTEFDAIQKAFSEVDLNEEVMPIYNGRYLNENADCYCKMKKILDTPEMIKAHQFVYNLDPSMLSEEEAEQVNHLFQLGVDRGFIDPNDNDDETPDVPAITSDKLYDPEQGMDAKPESPKPFSYQQSGFKAKIPSWTILYSACKGGECKCGECYSNSLDMRAAKADCYAKLSRCGYDNISILAVEAGDPEMAGCSEEFSCKEPEVCVSEDDMLKVKPHNGNAQHNGHISEAEDSVLDDPSFGYIPNSRRKAALFDKNIVVPPDNDEKDSMKSDSSVNKELLNEFTSLAEEYCEILEYHSKTSIIAKKAFSELKDAFDECVNCIGNNYNDLKNLYGIAQSYDLDVDTANKTLNESGNPYVSGMKTMSLNGASSISCSKPKKRSTKKVVKEEDDDSSEDSSSEDSSDDTSSDDSTSEDTSSEDSSDDTSSDDTSSDDSTSEDTSDDNTSDESSEDTSDEDTSDNDTSDDDTSDESNEDTSDEDASDEDTSDEDTSDESSEDTSDDDTSDDDTSDEDTSDDDTSDEDTSDESSEEKKELSDEDKSIYKNDFKKIFKSTMLKCGFEEKCFDDLTISEKVKFFTDLGKVWKKNDPKDFMDSKELDQLNKTVVKK